MAMSALLAGHVEDGGGGAVAAEITQGLMLARAYQDYGAHVTDRAGDPVLAYVEPSAAGKAFTDGLLGPSWTASDLKRIRAQLRIVTNNGPGTPNGAELGGARRAAP